MSYEFGTARHNSYAYGLLKSERLGSQTVPENDAEDLDGTRGINTPLKYPSVHQIPHQRGSVRMIAHILFQVFGSSLCATLKLTTCRKMASGTPVLYKQCSAGRKGL
jgi:hypothetical protein